MVGCAVGGPLCGVDDLSPGDTGEVAALPLIACFAFWTSGDSLSSTTISGVKVPDEWFMWRLDGLLLRLDKDGLIDVFASIFVGFVAVCGAGLWGGVEKVSVSGVLGDGMRSPAFLRPASKVCMVRTGLGNLSGFLVAPQWSTTSSLFIMNS